MKTPFNRTTTAYSSTPRTPREALMSGKWHTLALTLVLCGCDLTPVSQYCASLAACAMDDCELSYSGGSEDYSCPDVDDVILRDDIIEGEFEIDSLDCEMMLEP